MVIKCFARQEREVRCREHKTRETHAVRSGGIQEDEVEDVERISQQTWFGQGVIQLYQVPCQYACPREAERNSPPKHT